MASDDFSDSIGGNDNVLGNTSGNDQVGQPDHGLDSLGQSPLNNNSGIGGHDSGGSDSQAGHSDQASGNGSGSNHQNGDHQNSDQHGGGQSGHGNGNHDGSQNHGDKSSSGLGGKPGQQPDSGQKPTGGHGNGSHGGAGGGKDDGLDRLNNGGNGSGHNLGGIGSGTGLGGLSNNHGLNAAGDGLKHGLNGDDPLNGNTGANNGAPDGQSGVDNGTQDNGNGSDPDNLNPDLNDNLNPGANGGVKSGLNGLPNMARNLGGRAKSGYGKFMNAGTAGVSKVASKLHTTVKPKVARGIVHLMMASALGGAGLGLYYLENQNRPLDAGQVCATQNTGEQQYSDSSGKASDSAAGWTKKGSTQYKNAEGVIDMLKGLGFSGNAIAGICGNLAQESGFQTGILNQNGNGGKGDGGLGLMQWTGGRRTKLDNLAKSKGLSETSLKLQLIQMKQDLSNRALYHSAYKHLSPSILSHASSPADAALRFYLSGFEAGEGFSTPPDGSASNRQKYAQQAYSTFNLGSIKGDDSQLNSLFGGGDESVANNNAATAENKNNADCSNQSNNSSGDTSDVLKTAESLLGYFTYSQPQRTDIANSGSYTSVKKISDVKKSGHTDCSGFVWLCLKLSGHKVPDAMWATSSMQSDARGAHHYLKQVPASQAKAGDIVIMNVGGGSGDDGHTAILRENLHGDPNSTTNSTKIIHESTWPNSHVSHATLGPGFLSLIQAHAEITFVEPVSK